MNQHKSLQEIFKRLRNKYPRFTQGFHLSTHRTAPPFDNHPGMTEPHTLKIIDETRPTKRQLFGVEKASASVALRAAPPQPRPARHR